MAIAAGTRLGPYEVLSAIGAGGMGEVYEARDSRLGRSVAIKVPPATFLNDPERLSRFQREARMLAALNHPNIATIYGFEHYGGVHFLSMELVSGEMLAERVKAGPLPVDVALKIAAQIAEALEAAHEKNIIHRDLKPANVKVTPEGKVKVLDFGLAKAFEGDLPDGDMNNSPTVGMATTMQGVILGTAGYMSPEQARAKTTDKRTDLWAFGCVLYELLTGKQAFHAETVSDTTVKILTGEPDWNALPRSTPGQIQQLLRRCLQKDKAHRMQAAGNARIEIQEALASPSSPKPEGSATRWLDRGWLQIAVATLVVIVLLVVSVVVTWNLKPSLPQFVTRAAITFPPGQQLAGLESGPAVALSPDGNHLAYVAKQGGVQQLYLRAMDSQEGKPIPGTEGAVNSFFSSEGQWLGFFAGGSLKKVPVGGGAPQTLANAALPRGASWSSRGTVAFAPSTNGALLQVPDTGGTPKALTRLEKGDITQRWPEFLPGGKELLFSASANTSSWTNAQVAVHSLGTGERRNLIQGGNPRYAPSGHLVYSQGGSLMAVPFDLRRLEVTGPPVVVVERVLQSSVSGVAQYSFSSTGSVVYIPGGTQSAQSRMVWVSRSGVAQPLDAPVRPYRGPRLSPDGRQIAVAIEEEETQTWVYDVSRGTLTRLTFAGTENYNPVWTPDGKRLVFNSNKEGPFNLFWQLADGSGGLERLTNGQYTQAPMSWSPDGQVLAFIEMSPATGRHIWMLSMGDSSLISWQIHKPQIFRQTQFTESAPRFSPDGRWLAYLSNESGRFEIYVEPYPGPGGKWQISTEGGTEPVWNPNGRELFYRSGDKMFAVAVATQPSFSAGKPRMLFEGKYESAPGTFPNYDVSAGGQRFLMLKFVEQVEEAPTQINVVLNWFEELKRRVPTGAK